jgi:hypothetical protein
MAKLLYFFVKDKTTLFRLVQVALCELADTVMIFTQTLQYIKL